MLRNVNVWNSPRVPSQWLSASSQTRWLHSEGFSRLSKFWTPTGGLAQDDATEVDSNALLVRASFIRQSHAGIFQFLPLGLRVQDKVEKLIDKHMGNLGASKVSLSTFSSEDLWRASGRLQGDRSDLFSLQDRKGTKFLLSPTHEEEITTLVKGLVHSYKDLPVRLYQVTRKYRDEPRPRQGLLRTREFLMKDLYTFDATKQEALQTYESVRGAYRAFFDELKLPYIVADADSGNIGGDLSHEYHIVSSKGEDKVFSCSNCKLSFNEEVLDEASTLSSSCPKCTEPMEQHTTIELGHTFYLGTKYSKPLGATVTVDDQSTGAFKPIEMGCHGIGISRLIAGVANLYSDNVGLGWSRAIAPFELCVIQDGKSHGTGAELAATIAGNTSIDTVLDDRLKNLIWRMKDADLIGYPVLAILGTAWKKNGQVEIQCRKLNVKQNVDWADVPSFVSQLLNKY